MKKVTFVGAALVAALGMGCAMAAPTQTQAGHDDQAARASEQPATDTWITAKVKTELAKTDGVKSMDVEVTTTNGVVALTGVLDNDVAVRKAVAAAKSVKGVKDVDASGLKARD